MVRQYYSSRTNPQPLSVDELYGKLKSLYLVFRDGDFFKQKAGIVKGTLPDAITHKAAVLLNFQPFPITKWIDVEITEDNIFDVIEFLYDHVSKPGEWGTIVAESGYNYNDYLSYHENEGKQEFREMTNAFLANYKTGFELTEEGLILAKSGAGLQHIIDAEILPFDEENVDKKVRHAIAKWRNRHLSLAEKREAIRDLADVFEWLKKTKRLSEVLDSKDESAIFELANCFGIRHHNPKQKTNYDQSIWYSWIFHFYLATYHAVVRLLLKKQQAAGRKALSKPSVSS